MTKLRQQREVIARDLELVDLEPRQARERLLAQVKFDQEKIVITEKRIAELQEDVSQLRKASAEAGTVDGMTAAGVGEVDQSKIEVLQRRDADMTEFINSFEANKEAILVDQARSQQAIVALLEHISQGLEAQHTIPEGKEEMDALHEENDFKEKHLKTSEATMRRLQAEKEKRLQELEKVKQLDEKLPQEIAAVRQKKEVMEADLLVLNDLDGLRSGSAKTKAHLEDLRQQYIKRRDGMRGSVSQQSRMHEQYEKELASNDTARSLDSLEQKLRSHETNIFSLKEYIETKGREIDFESLREKCKSVMTNLNDILRQQQESIDKAGGVL
jgi:intraflagellar transport protein 74